MNAAELLADLEAAWPIVRTVPDWETRGGAWTHGKPIGVMEHHTALPVPYPVDRLYGALLKCNINTKPDGTVWLLAYYACNYSSGLGSGVVLGEVLSQTAPIANARERGLTDTRNGNPLFFNFENDHPGDGSPIPAIQHEAIVVSTRVVLDHFSRVPAQTISHAEWTARKRDPYWNRDLRAIEAIRAALELEEEDDDMWNYITVDERLVRFAYERGWLQPNVPATLTYFLNAVASGDIHNPKWGDYHNFRRSVTEGILYTIGGPSNDHIRKVIANAIENG